MRSRFASRNQSWRWRWQVWYAGTGSGVLATAPLSLKPTEFRWASLSSHRPRKPLAAAFLMRAVLPSLDSLIESPTSQKCTVLRSHVVILRSRRRTANIQGGML